MDTLPYEELGRAGRTRRLTRLVLAALGSWDLPVATVRKQAKGWNATFLVTGTDGAAYLLRVQRPDGPSPDAVRAEAGWLAALHRDTDLLVPEPVPTRSGDLITVATDPGVPGERACVLYRWIDGRFLEAGLTPAHLYQVGVLTAGLQLHGATMPPLDRPRPDAVQPDGAAMVAALTSPGYGEVVEAVVDRYRAVRELVGPAGSGLIHADLHQENYLFTGGRVGAIDFDDCGHAPYVYDLGVTLSELWNLPGKDELRAALLAGYRTLRPLPAEHEAVLDDIVAFRYVQLHLYGTAHRDEPMFREFWREDLVRVLDSIRRRWGLPEPAIPA